MVNATFGFVPNRFLINSFICMIFYFHTRFARKSNEV